jgi:hypothetical protein
MIIGHRFIEFEHIQETAASALVSKGRWILCGEPFYGRMRGI